MDYKQIIKTQCATLEKIADEKMNIKRLEQFLSNFDNTSQPYTKRLKEISIMHENGLLNENQKLQVTQLIADYEYHKDESVDTLELSRKYLTMGWYVYKHLLKE